MNIMNIGLTTAEIIKKAGLLSDMGGGSQQNFVGGAVGGALSGLQQNVTNIGGKQYIQNPDGTFKTTDGKPINKDGSNAIPSLADGNQVFITPTIGFILEF